MARSANDALDAELARRVEAQARTADALVELEHHPGHRLLAGATLTGASARRWAEVTALLPRLWADLTTHRTTVAAACAVRTRRPRPGEQEWAALHRLLRESSVEVDEPSGTVTLEELAERMDRSIREVVAALETAEAVHLAALAGLGPLAERLRSARALAEALLDPVDPDAAALAALTTAVDERIAACTRDPFAQVGRLPADLAGDLDDALDPVEARLSTLAGVAAAWPQRRAEVRDAVAALDVLGAQEDGARRAARAVVADSGLAPPPDARPALHRRLAALPDGATPPGPAALAALAALAADAQAAADALRAATGRAEGLVERRDELRGRFAAYRAKAVRLGVAEEPEVRELAARVRALLHGGPADLRAATPALVAYQRGIQECAGDRASGAGRT